MAQGWVCSAGMGSEKKASPQVPGREEGSGNHWLIYVFTVDNHLLVTSNPMWAP